MVLPSNSSMRYFPENTTTSFTTELPQRLDLLGRWEVALTEIQFPCSFFHMRPGEGLIKFIDTISRDKTAKAMTARVPSGVYSNVHDIIEAVNNAANSVDSHVTCRLDAFKGGRIIIGVTCEKEKCGARHFVHFSEKLCRILGFDVHNKERGLDELDIDPISPVYLPVWFYRELGIDIYEKKDENNVAKSRQISSALADSLPEWVFDEIRSPVFYNAKQGQALIGDKPASLSRAVPDKLFVYCDICEPYITGDVQTPLLRIVALNARNEYSYASTQIRHFSPAQYISLRQTCFRTIEIDIRDQLGKSIPFEFGTLTVTLHFRRIQ